MEEAKEIFPPLVTRDGKFFSVIMNEGKGRYVAKTYEIQAGDMSSVKDQETGNTQLNVVHLVLKHEKIEVTDLTKSQQSDEDYQFARLSVI